MKIKTKGFLITGCLIQVTLACTLWQSQAFAATAGYATMAPLDRYLMPEPAEIALARSAAPPSVSDGAEVMVLGRNGYRIAVKGSNGFVCIVERSWTRPPSAPQFWNPKVRAPICFSPQAASSFVPIDIMKTKLVLEGKSRAEIAQTIASAFDKGELPALKPGAMCYMMSKEQYLNDQAKNWHPHLMFYVSGNVAKSWGANLPDSPVIAADDREDGVTVFMVWVNHWSDGTPFRR